MQAAGGVGIGIGGGVDWQTLDAQHVAGVQARVHLHDRDAGLSVPSFNRAVDGRRAAPTGQQTGVDVEALQARGVQHPLRQNQPVGRHHASICCCCSDGNLGGGGVFGVLAVQAQAARLGDRDAVLQRQLFDGGGLQLHAAPGRAVRLGQHQGHFKPRGQQVGQGDAGELRGAGEDDAKSWCRR